MKLPDNTPRQLPLGLDHAPARTRDDLVVTDANAAAVSLADEWPDWPSPVVILAGPPGAGKSHIAAIWRDMSGAAELPRGALAGGFDAAEPGPVLVEDADAGGLDEAGLFHLINDVRASGTHLLLTARRFPLAWGVTLPDLESRLRAATLVEIAEPDDALLSGVLVKLFADRQLSVEPHVISYVAHRIERSLATAADVVRRIDEAAMAQQARISRQLAASVISGLDEGQGELGF